MMAIETKMIEDYDDEEAVAYLEYLKAEANSLSGVGSEKYLIENDY